MRFGRHVVIEPLGSGAMGAVYRARDEQLGREVAIKTIHRPGLSAFQQEMFQARFANEARAIAALSHPNVLHVYDVGVENGTPFLVMELAQGQSLAARLGRQGRLGAGEARQLGQQIAGALEAAHARGIVHRDVKPANILEAGPGTWKLADFGIAHMPDSSLTIAGQFLGSPAYSAPEALDRGEFGPGSDVYGLGATLYEALTGDPPAGTGGLKTVLEASSNVRPIGEVRPELPADLAAAIMGALARDPARRSTAAALRAALAGTAAAAPVEPLAAPAPAALAPRPANPTQAPQPVATATAAPAPATVALAEPAAVVPAPTVATAAPSMHADAARRRRNLLIAGGVAVLLLVGIMIGLGAGGSSSPAPVPSRPSPAERMSGWPAEEPAPATGRSGKHAERWNNAQDKLRKGEYKAAAKQLEKLLDDYPDDAEARALLEQLYGE